MLKFNYFDIGLVGLMIFGFWRGRRRGMTKELFPTLQWIAILLVAGLGHIYLADLIQQNSHTLPVFSLQLSRRTPALMTGYLAIALVLFVIFVLIRRKYYPKLEGSNFFGGNEYYWGVAASLIRYTCLVLVGMALLNAPTYTAADIAATEAYNNRWYGGGMKGYSGDFIPSTYNVQEYIFKQSFVGSLVKQNLSVLLINSNGSDKTHAHS